MRSRMTTGGIRSQRWKRWHRSSATWRAAQLRMTVASDQVIVDHPGCLHEGVADRRPHELESPRVESLTHPVGFPAACGKLFQGFPLVVPRFPADQPPDEGVERSHFFL